MKPLTKVTADAIVNTANPRPVIGGGTDSAIYAAAGEEGCWSVTCRVKEECRKRLPEDLLTVLDRFWVTVKNAQALVPQNDFLAE